MGFWDAFVGLALVVTALVTPFEVAFLEPNGADVARTASRHEPSP